ncbi:hypothetical protein [uncultured Caulobacter sp.]|uniref:McrB family protein n=1 Tax=uncultured Caulobacter sp. TaxID=158749 RepID=UPI00261FF739|nr:hypothetical protein [uncultured Caulobacter sp.]
MSRFNPHHPADAVFAAAAHWRHSCLLTDGSALFAGRGLWTGANIAQVRNAFRDGAEDGQDSFLTKLRRQLTGQADAIHELAAELLWILLLFPSNIGADKKRETVHEVLSWRSKHSAPDEKWLSDDVLGGLGSAGTAFNTHRPREFAYLLDLVARLKDLPPPERVQVLGDAWAFSGFLASVHSDGTRQFSHIVEHLLFPDVFERISSGADKRRVIVGLGGDDPAAVKQLDRAARDRRLFEIRNSIAQARGSADFDFYEAEFASKWRSDEGSESKSVVSKQNTLPLGDLPQPAQSSTDRQKQFTAFVTEKAGPNAKVATNFGFSNSARLLEGGLFACTANMEGASKNVITGAGGASAYVFASVLTFPPYDEVYFAITVSEDRESLDAGLVELYRDVEARNGGKAEGDRPSRINNNVKFYLNEEGRIGFSNDFFESISAEPTLRSRSAAVESIEFAIWPPTVSARRSLLAREFVGYLGRLVGREKVHELKVWSSESGVGPLMQRMPADVSPQAIRRGVAALGGVYPDALIDRFHAGLNHLQHKHFVILSGLSGTGKTQLALQYARTIHGLESMEAADPLLFVCPVRPEWTDPSGLTGYEDRLSGQYVVPKFLEALLVATAHPASPVFVILDEMNLARVEYYFSDILSAIESRNEISLHSSGVPMVGSTGGEVPASLRVPHNLFLVGTINVDETTSTLSDKVMDRAVVIDMSDVDLGSFFDTLGAREDALNASIGACRPVLQDLSALLGPHGLGFGYRLAEEFVRYHAFATDHLGRSSEEVIDDQLVQKALARLRGSEAQRDLLRKLAETNAGRPRSRALIDRLQRDLDELGAFQTSR